MFLHVKIQYFQQQSLNTIFSCQNLCKKLFCCRFMSFPSSFTIALVCVSISLLIFLLVCLLLKVATLNPIVLQFTSTFWSIIFPCLQQFLEEILLGSSCGNHENAVLMSLLLTYISQGAFTNIQTKSKIFIGCHN